MKNKLIVLSGMVLAFTPVVTFAALVLDGTSSACNDLDTTTSTLYTLMCKFGELMNAVIPVFIALGIVYIIWGVVTLVIADDEEAKASGKDRVIYGIIGLAVIVGVWGLVNLVVNTFDLNNSGNYRLPTVPVVIPTINQN